MKNMKLILLVSVLAWAGIGTLCWVIYTVSCAPKP